MDRIYDAYMGEMGEEFQQKTKERIHWICDHAVGKSVLDVGCSQGIGSILLGRRGFSVCGMDVNEQAIYFAQNLLNEESETTQKNVIFRCDDFIEYAIGKVKADTVIFGEVLEHLTRPDLFIVKAYQVLNESGTLIITVPFGINDDPDHKQTFYFSRLYRMIFKYFTVETVKVFGKWIGFIGQKRETIYEDEIYCSCEELEYIEDGFYIIERELLNAKKASDVEARLIKNELAQLKNQYEILKSEKESEVRMISLQLKEYERKKENIEKKYATLARSKLGRITIKYWKAKGKIRLQFRRIGSKVKRHLWVKNSTITKKAEKEMLPQHIPLRNDSQLPSISVIIPTYKENSYILKTVDSVLMQDYPQKKLQIVISVNGDNEDWYQSLLKRYSGDERIMVVYTPKKGAAAGRNYAVPYAKGDCIAFLDDDDYWEIKYLREMAMHMTDSVTIVFGAFLDFKEDTGHFQKDNYINSALNQVGEGLGKDYERVSKLLSTICGKLYKRNLWMQFDKLDETVKNTEDVIFWAMNCEKIQGYYYTCAYKKGCSYVRRVTENSLSRPNTEDYFNFYVVDRLAVIDKLSNAVLTAKTEKAKRFIKDKIKGQVNFIVKAIPKCIAIETGKAFQLIRKSDSIFLNQSQFSNQNAIAFCHNFSPTADPSAYVATKRLSQISEREGMLNWTVFRGDMSNCRKMDQQFENFYGCYQYTKCIIVGKNAAFNEKAQLHWGEKAYEDAEKEGLDHVKVIYSRSMWAGSHVAAELYKKAHPEVIWYAEFSDPVYMTIGNQPRKASKTFLEKDEGLNNFWFSIEQSVYENADYVIFTNENQREYMLGYYPNKETCDCVRKKSLVMNHPVIAHKYCELFHANLELDPDDINIAYFGSFYANRRADDLWSLLDDKRVKLYLFISDSGDMNDIGSLPERVIIHDSLKYFEFLNAASRMDYLVLMDTTFEIPEINPYLPSKLADYLTAETPIIAFINEGSALSKMDNEFIIKVNAGSKMEISLEKKKEKP